MTAALAPERWTTTRLGWLFQPVSDRGHGDARVLSVYRDFGVIPKDSRTDNFNRTPESLSHYQLVQRGDLVVNRMKAWQGSLGVSEHEGIVSPDYEVLRPTTGGNDGRFVHSLLRSRGLIDQYGLRSTGIRPSQWRLYWDEMKTIEVVLPSPAEQRAIADYLDRETSRIDTLIEEQQCLIEMLRERRLGVVRAGVTGLLSGGRRGTSDTWFGTLPDAWTSARVRYDFTVILGKMINASKVPLEETVDAPYLAAGSIQPEALVLDDSKRMVFTRAELTTLDLREGDVVVVEGGAGYGRSHYLRRDLIGWGFQNHVARLRPSTGRVDGLFATYCLKACLASGYIEANNRTATLPSLSRDVLGSIQIPVPPMAEQRRITRYLDEQTAKIDALIAETERFIELSRERRAALITAAVTGQIDLRKVA